MSSEESLPPGVPIDPRQMELFAAYVTSTPADYANVFEMLDSVMIFSSERVRAGPAPDVRKVTLRGFRTPITVESSPAAITENGHTRYVMPGKREELIERGIRKLASENIHRLGLEAESDSNGTNGAKAAHVTVMFSLSQLRSTLRRTGHDFKLVELREGLTVLKLARMDFRKDSTAPSNVSDPRLTRLTDGGTYLQRVQTLEDPRDPTGERVYYKITLNPLASQAILEKSYRLIDFPTLMTLKTDLARWFYVRLANRYKQASHEARWLTDQQYHIAWSTIAAESGIKASVRMRENLAKVNEAMEELKKKDVIESYTVKTERGRKSGTRGPAQVVEAVWNLVPSGRFVDDAVRSNKRFRGKELA